MSNVLFGNFGNGIWYPGDGAVESERTVIPEEEPLDNLEPISVEEFGPLEMSDDIEFDPS